MLGIIPAAGMGSRIQPLAFSKELLPVGSWHDGEVERPRAISEYLIDRMIQARTDRICIVVSPGKSDIVEYYGASVKGVPVCYVVQAKPAGLCDAIFCARSVVHPAEEVVVGLPDTLWFPESGMRALPDGELSFLLFPVDRPWLFDAVVSGPDGSVSAIEVKNPNVRSSWVWGAFKMPESVFRTLFDLWCRRDRQDEYVGTLVNAYLSCGGSAKGVKAGEAYVDVGTLDGYRHALAMLSSRAGRSEAPMANTPGRSNG